MAVFPNRKSAIAAATLVTAMAVIQSSAQAQQAAGVAGREKTAQLAAAVGFLDVAGLKLGSPLADAQKVLKGVNPKFSFFTDNVEIVWPTNQPPPNAPRSLTNARAEWVDNANSERFSLTAAAHPNPHVIIGIERQVQYGPGTGPNMDNIVAGLRKKYGPESVLAPYLPKETWRATWFFDERGQVLRGNVVNSLAGCGGLGTQSPVGLCATLTVMNVGIDGDSSRTVLSMLVKVQSHPLTNNAEETKQAFLAQTAEQLRLRQQKESSQREGPKL